MLYITEIQDNAKTLVVIMVLNSLFLHSVGNIDQTIVNLIYYKVC